MSTKNGSHNRLEAILPEPPAAVPAEKAKAPRRKKGTKRSLSFAQFARLMTHLEAEADTIERLRLGAEKTARRAEKALGHPVGPSSVNEAVSVLKQEGRRAPRLKARRARLKSAEGGPMTTDAVATSARRSRAALWLIVDRLLESLDPALAQAVRDVLNTGRRSPRLFDETDGGADGGAGAGQADE